MRFARRSGFARRVFICSSRDREAATSSLPAGNYLGSAPSWRLRPRTSASMASGASSPGTVDKHSARSSWQTRTGNWARDNMFYFRRHHLSLKATPRRVVAWPPQCLVVGAFFENMEAVEPEHEITVLIRDLGERKEFSLCSPRCPSLGASKVADMPRRFTAGVEVELSLCGNMTNHHRRCSTSASS